MVPLSPRVDVSVDITPEVLELLLNEPLELIDFDSLSLLLFVLAEVRYEPVGFDRLPLTSILLVRDIPVLVDFDFTLLPFTLTLVVTARLVLSDLRVLLKICVLLVETKLELADLGILSLELALLVARRLELDNITMLLVVRTERLLALDDFDFSILVLLILPDPLLVDFPLMLSLLLVEIWIELTTLELLVETKPDAFGRLPWMTAVLLDKVVVPLELAEDRVLLPLTTGI